MSRTIRASEASMAMAYDPDFDGVAVKGMGWPACRPAARSPFVPWGWVYLANLPVAMLLGSVAAYGPGLIGMGLGVAGLYGAGRWARRDHPRAVRMVCYGGVLVAVLQIFPLIQVFAGVMGIAAANLMGQVGGRYGVGPLTVAGGLVATLVTGGLLIALAGMMGLLFVAVRCAASPSFREAVDAEAARPFKR